MKISLSWLFDYIEADWHSIDVPRLIAQFNKTTAEIESYHYISLDLNSCALGSITALADDTVEVIIPEWQLTIQLPPRTDGIVGNNYLISKNPQGYSWTLSTSLGATKEFIIPAVSVTNNSGAWKKEFEHTDWIIEVDNKSINHRPDLWSHRGLAREIAAILDLPFKKIDQFIADYPSKQFDTQASAERTGSFAITLAQPSLCKRYAGVEIAVNNRPSLLSLAMRLIRIDNRPIDAVIDITNYVMHDIGQPMHAFDVKKLASKTITVRLAHAKEKVTLLDGQSAELTPQDMVVADTDSIIALAGIMGSNGSGVDIGSTSVFLEAGNFDASMIRKTAAHVKRRTEASTRFEKSIDPNQNMIGILRYLNLAISNNIINSAVPQVPIISLGQTISSPVITLKHAFIQKCLGVSVKESVVASTLERLDFKVMIKEGIYTITVPTFRATKDIRIAQDIVEEVGRFIGYDTLEAVLPVRAMAPFDVTTVMRLRLIKQILAYGSGMHEVYNYALHDQDFLNLIGWQPAQAAEVLSPVSENWRLLVTTLIPGLLKNIHDNAANRDQLSFFENARSWHTHGTTVVESKRLAGIFYNKYEPIDFYQMKAEVQKIFDAIKLSVDWQTASFDSSYPWFEKQQAASIIFNGKKIGTVGKINQTLLHKITPGDAFLFELDAQLLLSYRHQQASFSPLSKYQPIHRDISMLVPRNRTVAELAAVIKNADVRIDQVTLIDLFEKPEWKDQKSITFRFVITDHEKTMSKEDAELVWQEATENLKKLGAHIR